MTDAFKSNGTCYYAKGEEAADKMIPCGNSAYGHISCCQAGDTCLSSLACFNQEFGVTYLAGCTDGNYADKSCPDKKGWSDQPWTGLVYCNGTSNQWVACEEKAKEPTITSADACWCPEEDRTVAFEDAKSLTPVASLPTALGGVVDFEKDFYPTDKTLTGGQPDQTSDGSNTDGAGSPTGSGSVPDSTSAPSNDGGGSGSSSGLGKGAKIGIGVGVAAAVLFILAALAFFFMRRRKQQRDNPSENLTGSLDDPKQDLTGMGVTPDTPATSVPSELESRAARPWSMRSELQTPDTPLSIADRAEADSLATGDKNGHQFQGQNTLRPTDVPAVLRPGPPPGAGAGTQAQGPLSPVAELPG